MNHVFEVAMALVVVPACIWGIKTLLEVKEAMGQLRIVLIGIDGQNGMRSTLDELKGRTHDLEHRVTVLEHPPREAA